MSKLRSGAYNRGGLGHFIDRLTEQVNRGGSSFIPPEQGRYVATLESLVGPELDSAIKTNDRLQTTLEELFREVYGSNGFSLEHSKEVELSLTPAQKEAGAIILGSYHNVVDYATKGHTNFSTRPTNENMKVVMPTTKTSSDHRLVPATEAFNESELRATLPTVAVFNTLAARQGEFCEAFYPTVVVSPDMAGLDVTVRLSMVYNEVRHSLAGTPTNFNRRNLLMGAIDPTILADRSNQIIPMLVTTGTYANSEYFVTTLSDGKPVPSQNVSLDDSSMQSGINPATGAAVTATIPTAPLKFGIDMNLLGLSQNGDIRVQGQLDSTDSLDPRVNLQTLYLQVGTAVGSLGTGLNADSLALLKLDVSRHPRNQWIKSQEGNSRELNLSFRTSTLMINANTIDYLTGVSASAANGVLNAYFTANPNNTILLGMNVGGYGNVEYGTIQATGSTPIVEAVYQTVNGVTTDITNNAGVLAAAQSALGTMILTGFDVFATRSNLNRRTRGLLLESVEYTERYIIPLQAPLTIPSPVGSNHDASDLNMLINAARIRNDNYGVTALLQYSSTLSSLANMSVVYSSVYESGDTLNGTLGATAPVYGQTVPFEIEGMGRYLVQPFYFSGTLDVAARLNTMYAQDRMADVRAVFVNYLQELSYRMYRDSAYQPALDAETNCSGERPIVLIGTDAVISKYLYQVGDTRTLGIQLDSKVVVSLDSRVFGQIFMTLTRERQTDADPLCFGQFPWIPELASTVQVTRNGATIKESMVQPRALHVNNLPILAQITVVNLQQAVTNYIALKYATATQVSTAASAAAYPIN